MNLQKEVLTFAFSNIYGELQFLFAFVIPAAKEMNKRILSKLVSKMASEDDEMAFLTLTICLNIFYSLFIAIRLNGAEMLTVVTIIIVDFLMHLRMTHQIVKLKNKVTVDIDDTLVIDNLRRRTIQKLILAELVEGLVPLAYAIGFAMAYFGPNGYLLGNVLSDIWAYEKVEDFGALFNVQFLLFGVDCIGVILNTIILSKFGNVNLIQEFCNIIESCWKILAILLANSITIYFGLNDINAALDMTMEFEWITKKGRLMFIANASDLSDCEKLILLDDSVYM